MKNYHILIFLFAGIQLGMGQKLIRKSILNPESRSIQVDGKDCFQITLGTSKEKEIKVAASIEGEYQKDLVVKIEEDGSNLMISADFLPNFIAPNDKLSAHKVLSIALNILLPEYCRVSVFGTNSKVNVTGKYRKLKISLDTGDCILDKVIEDVEVKTQKGAITIIAAKGKIEAASTYGIVETAKIPEGNPRYDLISVEGNIYLKKTE